MIYTVKRFASTHKGLRGHPCYALDKRHDSHAQRKGYGGHYEHNARMSFRTSFASTQVTDRARRATPSDK